MPVIRDRADDDRIAMRNSTKAQKNFALDRHLFFWTTHVSVLYAVQMRKAMRGIKVNLPTWRTLAVLNELGPATLTDLAAATVVERTALTRTISQMENRGLIERESDTIDRRRARIAVTGKGVELYEKVVPIFEATQRRAMGNITPTGIQTLIGTLREIAENLEGHAYDPLMRRHYLPPQGVKKRKAAKKG
jgi:DNA-binding MarR family transcriptional regulator